MKITLRQAREWINSQTINGKPVPLSDEVVEAIAQSVAQRFAQP